VLVVCLGPATRLIEYVQRQPKSYRGAFLLGRTSDTEDIEGQVLELPDPPRPTLEQLQAAALALTGEIMQRPPAYSALKVDGRRAYALARAGQEVELQPRPVTIYRLQIERYEYPDLTLAIDCGSGTYVRSLGRDLAESVGTGAVMSSLVRTAIGNFTLADAIDPATLDAESLRRLLRPPVEAIGGLPQIDVGEDDARRLLHGLSIADTNKPAGPAPEYAAIDAAGRLLAILAPGGADELRPVRVFPPEAI
jgi:tRNA pseudouridine55 synthase